MIQVFTGILLMTSYSPSSSMAWASVFYISHEMWWGWFIRGVHHFAAQAMVVLLVLHLLQVLWAGAYRRPREFNWWFGMALLFLTLGFSLTGYLLPWDQKGYWATKVATNIMGGAPVAGPYLQKILVGGPDYGNQTVTRFYGLHVGVLPTLLVLCLAAHIALFRRHGITPPPNAEQTADRAVLARTALHGHGFLRGRRRRRDFPGAGRRGGQSRRPRRSLQLRLPRAPRVVLPVALPDAQAVPRRSRDHRHDRDPDGPRRRHDDSAIPGSNLAAKTGPFSGMRLRVRGRRRRWLSDSPGDAMPTLHDTLVPRVEKKGRRGAPARHLSGRPARCRHSSRRLGVYPAPGPAHAGAERAGTALPGLPLFRGEGKRRRKPHPTWPSFGSRAWVRGLLDKPASSTYFGKVAKFDGMAEWKKSSKLEPQAARRRGGFRRVVRRHSRRHDRR